MLLIMTPFTVDTRSSGAFSAFMWLIRSFLYCLLYMICITFYSRNLSLVFSVFTHNSRLNLAIVFSMHWFSFNLTYIALFFLFIDTNIWDFWIFFIIHSFNNFSVWIITFHRIIFLLVIVHLIRVNILLNGTIDSLL